MQWEFTGEQVVKGEVGYTLEEFRKDYYEEIKANFQSSMIRKQTGCSE